MLLGFTFRNDQIAVVLTTATNNIFLNRVTFKGICFRAMYDAQEVVNLTTGKVIKSRYKQLDDWKASFKYLGILPITTEEFKKLRGYRSVASVSVLGEI